MASITLSAAELLLHRLQALDVAYILSTRAPIILQSLKPGQSPGDRAKGTGVSDLPA